MGFLGKLGGNVKSAALKTKLNGEIAMIDMEITTRKKTFGVELFDLILKSDKANETIMMPAIFSSIEPEMKAIIEPCRYDIQKIEKQINGKAEEVEKVKQKSKEHQAAEAATASSKAKKAGHWVSDGGKETAKGMQTSMLKSKIKTRKQQFGLDVWETVAAKQAENAEISGVEKEINDCIQAAKHDIGRIFERRETKKQAIEELK